MDWRFKINGFIFFDLIFLAFDVLILFELGRNVEFFLDILRKFGIELFDGLYDGLNLVQEKDFFFVGTGTEKMAGLLQHEAEETDQDVNQLSLVGVLGKSHVEDTLKRRKLS